MQLGCILCCFHTMPIFWKIYVLNMFTFKRDANIISVMTKSDKISAKSTLKMCRETWQEVR